MTKKQKKTIREEIIKIISIPPKRKGDTGYLKLTDEEIDKIVELFRETLQRFIKETRLRKLTSDDDFGKGYNWAVLSKEYNEQQWLKENL